MATEQEVEARVERLLDSLGIKHKGASVGYDGVLTVELSRDYEVTFSDLSEISEALSTTDINLESESGWYGDHWNRLIIKGWRLEP